MQPWYIQCICPDYPESMALILVFNFNLLLQEYVPTKSKQSETESVAEAVKPTVNQGTPSYGETPHYQHKYKHLLGLDCAEKSAVKMEPNRAFGYGEFNLHS